MVWNLKQILRAENKLLQAENKRLREKVAHYINEARYHASWHRASVQEFYEYRAALAEKEE